MHRLTLGLSVLFFALAVAAPRPAFAREPSDSQIKKDLGGKYVISVKLLTSRGTVSGNRSTMNYEYVRRAELVVKTDLPKVKQIQVGDAVYQWSGTKFSYWKFRVGELRYDGIPNPTADEFLAVMKKDPAHFFGGGIEGRILQVHKMPELAPEPAWTWHSFNSVEASFVTSYDFRSSDVELETREQPIRIRLYRDEMDQPWHSYLVSRPGQPKILATKKLSREELDAMPSFRDQLARAAAEAQAEKRPKVDIPELPDALALFAFVHQAMWDGPRERAEAVLLAVLSPRYFADKERKLLTPDGAQLVERNLQSAFDGRQNYRVQYCRAAEPEPDQGTRNLRARVFGVFPRTGALHQAVSSFYAVRTGGKMVDGVRAGERWMLEEITLRTRTDDEAVEFVSSFSDRKKLCPADPG